MNYRCDVAHGIMFHHFHGARHAASPGSITADDLAAIIRHVGPDRILGPEEWMERAQSDRLGPLDLCLTFDDALLCQFEIALPVLQEFNLRAFWFIYSNVFSGQLSQFEVYRVFRATHFRDVDEFYEVFLAKIQNSRFADKARALDEKEIAHRRERFPFYSAADVRFRMLRDSVLTRSDYDAIMRGLIEERGLSLADLAENLWMKNEHLRTLCDGGHVLGLHSYSHPMLLGEQSLEEQTEEYAKNFDHLASISGPPRAVAYPAGSYSESTLTLLRSMGIACGFRSSLSPPRNGGPTNPSPLEVAREDHANILKQISSFQEA
jgi:peptidoglycan/xylan/chitin deacetylase (PgdA/CDA1 family)